MNWWKSVEQALQNLGGVSTLAELYTEVRSLRSEKGLSVPKSLNAVVRKELELNSSDSAHWQGHRDVFYSVDGIGNGVWGLRASLLDSPTANDLSEPDDTGENRGYHVSQVVRVVRDSNMVRKVKALYDCRCQICGLGLELPDGRRYVEAHHIIPLGAPHNGPDIASNIVVVCPNHHALLDFGAILLARSELKTAKGHHIAEGSLEYHNNRIVDPSLNSPEASFSSPSI